MNDKITSIIISFMTFCAKNEIEFVCNMDLDKNFVEYTDKTLTIYVGDFNDENLLPYLENEFTKLTESIPSQSSQNTPHHP
jgi:hypothetical protein